MLSAEAIAELTRRCQEAETYRFRIALADDFARELGFTEGDPMPPRVQKFSPAHLLHLLANVQPTTSSLTKFTKGGKKAARRAAREEDIPTVPVDVEAVKASIEAMRKDP
jgi:hypothetical protein